MTTHARFAFTVKEGPKGEPFIALEPLSENLSGEGIPPGNFTLELRAGKSMDDAQRAARFLNENFTGLAFTKS